MTESRSFVLMLALAVGVAGFALATMLNGTPRLTAQGSPKAEPSRVAVVDQRKVVRDDPVLASQRKLLLEKVRKQEAELRDRIAGNVRDLSNRRSGLQPGSAEWQSVTKELLVKRMEEVASISELADRQRIEGEEAMLAGYARFMKAVSQVALARGYTIVLRRNKYTELTSEANRTMRVAEQNHVVLVADADDITEDVLKAMAEQK